MIKHLCILLALFLSFAGYTQAQEDNTKYKVDSSIKDTVDKKTSSMNGVGMGQMKMRMYENDSLIIDTYGKEQKIEIITTATMKADTIHIIAHAGLFSGFGFYLDLFKDSCNITHLIKSDAEIYKMNKTDTTLTFGLSVPCIEKKLSLVNKPVYKEGEIIEGIIELSSRDYWEVANGHESKCSMQLKAFFKTEVKNRKR